METKNETIVKTIASFIGIVALIFIGTWAIIKGKECDRIENATSIELCGSIATTILIQKLPNKMPNVTYYAICRVGGNMEIKTK